MPSETLRELQVWAHWIVTALGIWCAFSPGSFVSIVTLRKVIAPRYAILALRVGGLLLLAGALWNLIDYARHF